ncbi:hypothetical protein DL93DRAFT_2082222 [Clavulina sp. PMI_390]|nr:hypothetical protein DL93DRAFT_2082222 [Clavulina sp. PMI_390]
MHTAHGRPLVRAVSKGRRVRAWHQYVRNAHPQGIGEIEGGINMRLGTSKVSFRHEHPLRQFSRSELTDTRTTPSGFYIGAKQEQNWDLMEKRRFYFRKGCNACPSPHAQTGWGGSMYTRTHMRTETSKSRDAADPRVPSVGQTDVGGWLPMAFVAKLGNKVLRERRARVRVEKRKKQKRII